MKKSINWLLLTFSGSILLACSNGNMTKASSVNMTPGVVTIGQMSVIPLLSANEQSTATSDDGYRLAISNNNYLAVVIESITVSNSNTASLANVSRKNCGSVLLGYSSCFLEIKPPADPGSFLLGVSYRDLQNGTLHQLKQLIEYGIASSNRGFYYRNAHNRLVVESGQTTVVSFPLILAANYASLASRSPFASKIDCNGYTQGSSCTLQVAINTESANSTSQVSIIGDLVGGGQNQLTLTNQITTESVPNLVVNSSNLVVYPANGEESNQLTLTLFNSGFAAATDLTIIPTLGYITPLIVDSKGVTIPCGKVLLAQNFCQFNINALAIESGQASVTITDAEGDSFSLPIYYAP